MTSPYVAPPAIWRRTRAAPSEFFSDEDLDRARRYQRPLRFARAVRALMSLTILVAIVLGGATGALVDALSAEGWVVQLAVVFLMIELLMLAVDVPVDIWVDFVHDRRWGLSTQSRATFVGDQAKSLVLSTVVGLVVLVPIYALIRATPWWWLIGWGLVTALGVILGFLFPVVVAPIFNRFQPLDDPPLAMRLREVADAAGVSIAGVLVADQSRRSRRDNAYVSGLGATRRIVLFDTILEHPPELIEQVVAHELGHWTRHHLRQQIPVLAATTLVAFLLLWALASWDRLWSWLGFDGIADPAALPVLLVAVQVVSLGTGLVTAYVSRAHEREADLDALEVLRQPEAMSRMLRRLHIKNISDLEPGPVQRLGLSHPTAAERLAFVRQWSSAAAARSTRDPFTSM